MADHGAPSAKPSWDFVIEVFRDRPLRPRCIALLSCFCRWLPLGSRLYCGYADARLRLLACLVPIAILVESNPLAGPIVSIVLASDGDDAVKIRAVQRKFFT